MLRKIFGVVFALLTFFSGRALLLAIINKDSLESALIVAESTRGTAVSPTTLFVLASVVTLFFALLTYFFLRRR